MKTENGTGKGKGKVKGESMINKQPPRKVAVVSSRAMLVVSGSACGEWLDN